MDECYNSGKDERCFQSGDIDSTVYNQSYGATVPRYCASLSIIGSSCIIFIILRSRTKVSSTYHRIMIAMSISDILNSLAMALTSLPIPKHGSIGNDEGGLMEKVVDFGFSKVTTYGNKATCEAQGFFFLFGSVASYSYNMSLCLYFVSNIVFLMREEDIKKRIGPALVFVPIFIALLAAFPPLFMKLYNPSEEMAWCTVQRCPQFCGLNNDCEIVCIRGSKRIDEVLNTVLLYSFTHYMVAFVGFYFIICLKVYKRKKLLANHFSSNSIDEQSSVNGSDDDAGQGEEDQLSRSLGSKRRMNKIVLIQSLAYILATMSTLLIQAVGVLRRENNPLDISDSPPLEKKLRLVLQPLQGFFNFFIFICNKIVNERSVNPDTSVLDIIAQLFLGSIDDAPILVTGLNLVRGHDERDNKIDSNEMQHNDEGDQQDDSCYDSKVWGSIHDPHDVTNNSGNSFYASSPVINVSSDGLDNGSEQDLMVRDSNHSSISGSSLPAFDARIRQRRGRL